MGPRYQNVGKILAGKCVNFRLSISQKSLSILNNAIMIAPLCIIDKYISIRINILYCKITYEK